MYAPSPAKYLLPSKLYSYLAISKLHSILAEVNFLAHNNISYFFLHSDTFREGHLFCRRCFKIKYYRNGSSYFMIFSISGIFPELFLCLYKPLILSDNLSITISFAILATILSSAVFLTFFSTKNATQYQHLFLGPEINLLHNLHLFKRTHLSLFPSETHMCFVRRKKLETIRPNDRGYCNANGKVPCPGQINPSSAVHFWS